jgi:hypothetical protein
MDGRLAHEEELGMAKHGKLLPARRQRDQPQDEESVFLRSAETIGRVIGSLQRQLDNARTRFADGTETAGNGAAQNRRDGVTKPKPAAKAKAKAKAKSVGGVRKASKSAAVARKTATTSRTAKTKRARKSR